MATFNSFEEIESWIKARKLAKDIYEITLRDCLKRDFSLKNQVNGSIGSVMDNIAEGFERGGNKEFIQFLYIAKGSSGETRSQLYRMLDRVYITQEEFDHFASELRQLSKMISGLITYLRNSGQKGSKFN